MTSRIPPEVLEGVRKSLKLPNLSHILNFSFASGGCISNGGKLATRSGDFFLKWNEVDRYPNMFETEARGLKLLWQAGAIRIPQVIAAVSGEKYQFLLLEHIEQATRKSSYWDQLGVQLAGLHKATAAQFGLDHDNYIGSLHQFNKQSTSWIHFFINQRLEPQLKMAVNNGHAASGWVSKFESLFARIPTLMPEEQPALLHGDLWSGNLIVDDKGQPCLIDPAVHFGHREADLAMTRLFGGFQEKFYDAYQEAFPLGPDFEERVELFNLYPLMVHVNLFGGSYIHSVDNVLRKYS